MTRAERLQASVKTIIDLADYAASVAINEAVSAAALAGAFSNSRAALTYVAAVETAADAALPELFNAYDAERSGLLIDGDQLDRYVLAGVREYYTAALRHGPDPNAVWGADHCLYVEALAEAQERTLSKAREHFLHPGLQPWHQRHSLAVAGVTGTVSLIAGAFVEGYVGKFLGGE